MATGLLFGCLLPHPPVLLAEVGGQMAAQVQQTVDATQAVARRLAEYEPETLIVMSPHGPLFRDRMAIGLAGRAQGDFSSFQAPEIKVEVECDTELARQIQASCERIVIPVTAADTLTRPGSDGSWYWLDHGAAVPLHFLLPLLGPVRVVLLGFSYLPRGTHMSFANRIRQVCDDSGKRVAFVASGDLSHRLLPTAPAGYDPLGKVFDDTIVSAIGTQDWDGILNIPDQLVDAAGVCGYLPLLTLTGVMRKQVEHADVLSYQAPFGVGYAVATLEPKLSVGQAAKVVPALSTAAAESPPDEGAQPTLSPRNETPRDEFQFEGDNIEQQILALARASFETYAYLGRRPFLPSEVPFGFRERRACFVTLRANGRLRGCVGTVLPAYSSLADEIIENALGAASRDYRFPPLLATELPNVVCSVDILSTPEPVSTADMLDPLRYGMVVKQDDRIGVLLPGIPEITTPEEQYRICLEKAGITTVDTIEIYRFEVTRYAEPGAEH